MSSETPNHLPKVIAVTPNPQHQDYFEATLSPYFQVSIYRDVDQTMEECGRDPAQVMVVDQNGRRDGNSDLCIEHSNRLREKGSGLVATAGHNIAFGILESMQTQIDQSLLKVFRAIFEPGSDMANKAT